RWGGCLVQLGSWLPKSMNSERELTSERQYLRWVVLFSNCFRRQAPTSQLWRRERVRRIHDIDFRRSRASMRLGLRLYDWAAWSTRDFGRSFRSLRNTCDGAGSKPHSRIVLMGTSRTRRLRFSESVEAAASQGYSWSGLIPRCAA